MTVEIGKFYRHFKGKLYQVLNLATDSETGEKVVVYQALYGTFEVYVRAYSSFTEMLDRNKYPNAAQLYRFVEVQKEALNADGNMQMNLNPVQENSSGSYVPLPEADRLPLETVAKLKNEEQKPVPSYAATPEGTVAPVLVLFLEADGSEAKYEVLKEHYLEIDERTMTNIEVSLDVVSNAKDLDERIRMVMDVLRTKAKYENNRLR